MSTDDDSFNDAPTPPRPPSERRMRGLRMSDEARARSHAEWARQRADAPVSGVPVVDFIGEPDPRETTDPVELWTRGYTEEDLEELRKLGMDPDSPVPLGQFVKRDVRRRKRETEQKKRIEMLADEQLRLTQAVTPERVAKLEQTIKSAKRILYSAVAAATASIGMFLGALRHQAMDEGRDGERLNHVEQDLMRVERQYERAVDQIRNELGRRSELEPNVSSADALVSVKGIVP